LDIFGRVVKHSRGCACQNRIVLKALKYQRNRNRMFVKQAFKMSYKIQHINSYFGQGRGFMFFSRLFL
jgi:hypothetical protein